MQSDELPIMKKAGPRSGGSFPETVQLCGLKEKIKMSLWELAELAEIYFQWYFDHSFNPSDLGYRDAHGLFTVKGAFGARSGLNPWRWKALERKVTQDLTGFFSNLFRAINLNAWYKPRVPVAAASFWNK